MTNKLISYPIQMIQALAIETVDSDNAFGPHLVLRTATTLSRLTLDKGTIKELHSWSEKVLLQRG
jgi:hypothetical protein